MLPQVHPHATAVNLSFPGEQSMNVCFDAAAYLLSKRRASALQREGAPRLYGVLPGDDARRQADLQQALNGAAWPPIVGPRKEPHFRDLAASSMYLPWEDPMVDPLRPAEHAQSACTPESCMHVTESHR